MRFIKVYFIAVFLCIGTFAAVAKMPDLERVEPSFWWIGMENAHVQLLVHGDNIAMRNVHFSYAGVQLEQVHKVENPNYLFVDINISASAKPGTIIMLFSKAGEQDIKYLYQLKTRTKREGRNQGVTNKDLIYLIMPDRFSNGDTQNDVVPSMEEHTINRHEMYARHGGDIQGVMNHLDYLKELGVTTVWLTPEIENDEPQASYHGYAVTDHYKIDPRYGTNELYKSFVDKCHRMGMKVIKDVVHNHCGSEHWFIKDMPMKDWVHQWPEYTNSNFRDQAVEDPHASAFDKKKMLDGWFDHHMPDLNENNPYVQRYLTQNHIWWLEYAGIDGLRLDTYPYNDPQYMSDWAQAVRKEFPSLSIFGETLVNSVSSQAFFTEGNTVNRGFDTHLPGVTDAQIKDAIYEALNGKQGWVDGVNRLYAIVAQDFLYKDPTRNCIFLDNHDMSRFYSMVNEDFDKYKSGVALLLTMRGVPELYYGTELLMKNYSNPDGLVREDFQGGWVGDSVNKFFSSGRTAKENEAFNYIKKLANYRKNSTVLQTGKLMQFIPDNGIYVYFRYNEDKTVMVVYNSNDKQTDVKLDRFKERTANFAGAVNILNPADRLNNLTLITLPARSTQVYELR
jgi:glycosidase